MKQHLEELIKEAIKRLQETEQLAKELLSYQIRVDRSRDKKHGDYASNIVLMLAKQANKNPRELAKALIEYLPKSEHVKKVEIAGPGFINFFVNDTAHQGVINDIFEQGDTFGRNNIGEDISVLLEFVSANPTGPLHVGHGRGAAYGSVCANLLRATGYKVHCEYYVNDAGRQMNILAVSVWLRYLELFGEKFDFPKNGYRGNYVIEISEKIKELHGDRFKQPAEAVFKDIPQDEVDENIGDKEAHIDGLIARAKTMLGESFDIIHAFGTKSVLDDIREDLTEFGVEFDEWFSEKSLTESGAVEKAIAALKEKNHLYEKDGAVWFRSTQFGDEKDRVLIRSNGQTTYITSDIAYHWNKLSRGFQRLINVLGADHHGYVPRLRAAIEALGLSYEALQIPLVQFAVLYRHGKKVQMSTRSGEFVTLRELREEVGNDAARFFYIMRKADQHMDFDLDLAKSKSNENPVYYIQYAHARICSVFRQLEEKALKFNQRQGQEALEKLQAPHEKDLMKALAQYPEVITTAVIKLEPHQLANYLKELAAVFHTYYNAEKIIVDDEALRNARLCLITATRQIIRNGLDLLGVSAPEQM